MLHEVILTPLLGGPATTINRCRSMCSLVMIPIILPSCISSSIIFFISSLAASLPWKLVSWNALQAGYAYLEKASATTLSFPGIYWTDKSNLDKDSCQRALRPAGPEGVSIFSLTQSSRDLWSVRIRMDWSPIQPKYFRKADTTA